MILPGTAIFHFTHVKLLSDKYIPKLLNLQQVDYDLNLSMWCERRGRWGALLAVLDF